MSSERRKLPEPDGPGAYQRMPGVESAGYHVYSHSPDPVPGRTPPNAVLLVFDYRSDGKPFSIVTRFKSRAALDQLIDVLERHAVDVWPRNTSDTKETK